MFEKDFPILKRRINGRRLVYLDNASTTQKPRAVIEAISDFYQNHNANIHRGIHTLSQEATQMYEGARDKVKKFINAKHRGEIIFTSGATEAINLVAWTWGHENIHRGDEILLTEMEHHSNLVPWQILAKKKGARLKFIPIDQTGRLDLKFFSQLLTPKTKLLSLTHVSNVLGTINPVEKMIRVAHKKGALVLIDGAQAGGHIKIDVQKLRADFYVFSGHKMYGPTGVGVLYGGKEILKNMQPYQTGGHMIKRVDWQSATWNDLPMRFEAGTANIADVIGLGAAVDFVNRVGLKAIINYESGIMNYGLRKLKAVRGITIYGPQKSKDRIGVISFNVAGVPPHDLASILDQWGIAIRTGHHCAMPLHQRLEVESSARVSLAIYNTKTDIDVLIKGIEHAQSIFGL